MAWSIVAQCRSVFHFGTSASMFVQFGTSAEMSWVRSVLAPKCLDTFLSWVMLFNAYKALKLHQRNRRRYRHLLIQSLQEGGIGVGYLCENKCTASTMVA